jgi:hypothetical protein
MSNIIEFDKKLLEKTILEAMKDVSDPINMSKKDFVEYMASIFLEYMKYLNDK